MIARIWRGWTKAQNADTYENLLREVVYPGLQKIDGYHGGYILRRGMFSLARHINYFGDSLWVTAWAILTRNIWSIIIPILITAMFVFAFIPSLTKHLKSRYGEDFDAWAKRTKAFVPFLY